MINTILLMNKGVRALGAVELIDSSSEMIRINVLSCALIQRDAAMHYAGGAAKLHETRIPLRGIHLGAINDGSGRHSQFID
jgi:hypothetical protein